MGSPRVTSFSAKNISHNFAAPQDFPTRRKGSPADVCRPVVFSLSACMSSRKSASKVLPAPYTAPYEPHWVSRKAYILVGSLLYLTQALIFLAVSQQNYWLSAPLILVASHLMHGSLIGFHEASHGMLKRSRKWNEFDGVLIGTLSFTSFSLYRASHQTHHAHLGTERDEELWPFVRTEKPRWFRVMAAFLELFFGLFYTPLLFLRTFLRKGSPIRARRVRRRIWWELALIGAFWTLLLTVVAVLGAWEYFFCMYLAPAFIAGNLQSWRKYIEHVGLTGSTVRSATRSIVANGPLGRLVSFTLLHEPYHGVHHQRAGLPHAELPGYAQDLHPSSAGECAPFPSYRQAFVHLCKSLADPRVGPQWDDGGKVTGAASATEKLPSRNADFSGSPRFHSIPGKHA